MEPAHPGILTQSTDSSVELPTLDDRQAPGSNPGSIYTSPEGSEDSDDDRMETDSAVDVHSYAGSSTFTAGSDLARAIEENGRTYHVYKDGRYMLPNDEIELNRLDIQNKMWLITLDHQLHLAPINPHLHNALDIGTGTGIWAIDFADAYPSARVIGTDLSIIQPSYVPVNCQFEIDDAEDDWVYSIKFDFIHGRALATCFADPRGVIAKIYDALSPGGYLEFHDIMLQTSDDGSIEGTALLEWQAHIAEAGAKMGRTWSNVQYYKQWMIEQGFEDVIEVRYRWPSNQWSEDSRERLLGAWMLAQVEAGILESASTRVFMNMLRWSKEQLDEFLAKVKNDMRNPRIKAYNPVVVVFGRKPLHA